MLHEERELQYLYWYINISVFDCMKCSCCMYGERIQERKLVPDLMVVALLVVVVVVVVGPYLYTGTYVRT